MENIFQLTFTVSLPLFNKEGFTVKTNLDSTIKGEFKHSELNQIAMEAAYQFGNLLAEHIDEAKNKSFSTQ